MSKKLQNALTQQKQQNEQVVPQITGILGLPLDGQRRVEVSNRNSYVYVRLRNNESEVIQAFNNQVAPAYNLPVLVEREGNRYIVIGVDTQRYENNWNSFAPFLPRHGNTHSFDLETGGGGDVVWVYPRQFTPLLTMPSGSSGGPNVIINPYMLRNNDGTWKYIGNTGTANITTYNPSSPTGAIIVLVYVDSVSGNPGLLVGSGTVFNNNITGVSQIAPYIPAITNPDWIPDSAIRLVTGTAIISWNNIYDVRQFLHPVPTGTGGGGSSFTGDANSVVLTDGSGNLDTMPWLKWGTSSQEFVEFGADEVKESNAGKIGYKTFDDYFDIVGAGTTGSNNRIVKIYDRLLVDRLNSLHGVITGSLQLGLSNGAPVSNLGIDVTGFVVTGTAGGGTISVQDEGTPLGSPSTFNFVGTNVSASVSGSVVRVFVTGSGGTPLTVDDADGNSVSNVNRITLTGTAEPYVQDGGGGRALVYVDKRGIDVLDVGGTLATDIQRLEFDDVSFSGTVARVTSPAATLLYSNKLISTDDVIDVYPLGTIPQTHRNIFVQMSLRTNRAAAGSEGILMELNDDSGNVYTNYLVWHNFNSVSDDAAQVTGTSVVIGYANAVNSPPNSFGDYNLWLYDYTSTSRNKGWQVRGGQRTGGATTQIFIYDSVGDFGSIAAITQIQLTPENGNSFIAGSSWSIWLE